MKLTKNETKLLNEWLALPMTERETQCPATMLDEKCEPLYGPVHPLCAKIFPEAFSKGACPCNMMGPYRVSSTVRKALADRATP